MNKIEALREMCEGNVVGSHAGNLYKLNSGGQLLFYCGSEWRLNNTQFLDYESFENWAIIEEPIHGHDWQWAMEQCYAWVKVRWYEWDKQEWMSFDSKDGYYYFGGTAIRVNMCKKYFTKKGWILA